MLNPTKDPLTVQPSSTTTLMPAASFLPHQQYSHSTIENKLIRLGQPKLANDRVETDSLSPSSQTSTLSSATASTPLPSSSSSLSQSPPPTVTSMSLRAADDFIRSSTRNAGQLHHQSQQPVQESILSSSSSSVSQRSKYPRETIRNPFRTSDLEAFFEYHQQIMTTQQYSGERRNRTFSRHQPEHSIQQQARRCELKRRSSQHEGFQHNRQYTTTESLDVSTSSGRTLQANTINDEISRIDNIAPTSSTNTRKKARSATNNNYYISSSNSTTSKTAEYDDANAKFKDFSIDSLLKSD